MKAAVVSVCGTPYAAVVAESFMGRLLGLHRFDPYPAALVVPGSSVHAFGLRQPIWVIGADERGFGIGGMLLAPRRVASFPGASAVVELAAGPHCAGRHRSHVVRWHR